MQKYLVLSCMLEDPNHIVHKKLTFYNYINLQCVLDNSDGASVLQFYCNSKINTGIVLFLDFTFNKNL